MPTPEHVPRRRFSADEVLRMIDAGVIGAEERVELLYGELVSPNPEGPEHLHLIEWLRRRLETAYGDSHHVMTRLSLRAGEFFMPMPDVVLIRGPFGSLRYRLPTAEDAGLIIEVGGASLHSDLSKSRVYAQAGVPELWVIDTLSHKLHVFYDPAPDDYRQHDVLSPGDAVALPEREGHTIEVREILEG